MNGAIAPLRAAGLLAADLASGPVEWKGFARVPARDANGWEDPAACQEAIAKRLGAFVRMSIQSVPFPLPFTFLPSPSFPSSHIISCSA